jgi:DNA-binding transcriptional ArsR family regulator
MLLAIVLEGKINRIDPFPDRKSAGATYRLTFAIDVLNALLRVRAEHVLNGDKQHPTTREIETNSGMSRDAVTAALKSLRSKGVIDAATWAAQADDMTQDENRWIVKL